MKRLQQLRTSKFYVVLEPVTLFDILGICQNQNGRMVNRTNSTIVMWKGACTEEYFGDTDTVDGWGQIYVSYVYCYALQVHLLYWGDFLIIVCYCCWCAVTQRGWDRIWDALLVEPNTKNRQVLYLVHCGLCYQLVGEVNGYGVGIPTSYQSAAVCFEYRGANFYGAKV